MRIRHATFAEVDYPHWFISPGRVREIAIEAFEAMPDNLRPEEVGMVLAQMVRVYGHSLPQAEGRGQAKL